MKKKEELKGNENKGGGHLPLVRKPWEDIIRDRVKSKTRLISKVHVQDVPTYFLASYLMSVEILVPVGTNQVFTKTST